MPGARWSCSGCAACCRAGYTLGPLKQQTIERIEASDLSEWWPAIVSGWYDTYTGPDGEVGRALRQENGQCVFLMPDDGCAIHRFVGAEAKPWFCQRFPMHTVEDPEGVVAIVRPACHGHHASFATAQVLDEAELKQVVQGVPDDRRIRFDRDVVGVLPGRGVTLDDWMLLEREVLATLDGNEGTPWDLARLVRERLRQILKGSWPEPDPQRVSMAVEFWLQALERLLAHAAMQSGGRVAHRERVDSVAALAKAAQGQDAEPELTPEAMAYVAHHLHAEILGKEVHSVSTFAGGVGRFLLGVDLVAQAWPQRPVPVEAFGIPWAHWSDIRLNRAIRGLHHQLGSLLVDRFLLC